MDIQRIHLLSPSEYAGDYGFNMEADPFAAFLSCLSRRFSLMSFFGVFSSRFGDFSPMARRLLPDGRQYPNGFNVFRNLAHDWTISGHHIYNYILGLSSGAVKLTRRRWSRICHP